MEKSQKSFRNYLNINNGLLLLIVIVGSILRFYNYSELPFSFDEFSALFRTRFDNFRDLIYFGVKTTDTHPAGVQVFMYYWVNIFGESEMMVKFPFILFGILSIIVAYKLGKKWFNPTVGLFTALFLAVLQYPITYSQFARPYVSGLFFSLLMVWFWTHVVFEPAKKRYVNVIGFILSSAVCAYNHHFSLLLFGLVGISGLFFLNKQNWKYYFIACLTVFIIYIPHLPIFFTQLNSGGVEEWLKKPDSDFILDYFQYILHFNPFLIGLAILLILLGTVFLTREFFNTNKFRILAFSWFAITYAIAHFYSVYINAVLQFSVLLFVFPFLILFLFSFYEDLKPVLKTIAVLLFMSAAIYTLIYERQHYSIMYNSAYKEILVEADRFQNENKQSKITTTIYLPKKIRDYYIEKLNIVDSTFYYPDSLTNYIQFRSFVKRQQTDYFVLGYSLTPGIEQKLIVEEEYPYLIERKGWFKGDFYVYAKNIPAEINYTSPDSILFSTINTFDTLTEGWDEVELFYQLTKGSNYKGDQILRFNNEFEYSPEFIANLSDITHSRTNEILISVDTYVPLSLVNPGLICDFFIDGKLVAWRSSNV
ncbi:MAG: glycosyltransferase family 39 protein, partial [Bacteroidales bacterium]|nr:glycosyltransferase family 39 protein [Bacteroidales bacterium]